MKISKREKGMLLLLVAFLIGYLYFQFFLTPLMDKTADLHMKQEQKMAEIATQKSKLQKMGDLELKTKKLKEEMKVLAGQFFTDMDQEEFIVLINELSQNSALDLRRLNFDEANVGDVAPQLMPRTEEEAAAETTEEGDSEENAQAPKESQGALSKEELNQLLSNIDVLAVQANFKGDYSQFRAFLSQLDDHSKRIVSPELNLKKSDDEGAGDMLDGDMTLAFFKIKDMGKYNTEEESILALPAVEKSEKKTPMDPYGWASVLRVTDIPPISSGLQSSGADGLMQIDPENAAKGVPQAPTKDTPIMPKNTKMSMTQKMMQPVVERKPSAVVSDVPQREEHKKFASFDTIDGVTIGAGTGKAKATVQYQADQGTRYQGGALLNYTFDAKGEGIVDLDLSGKDLKLEKRPKGMSFDFYAQRGTGHRLMVVLRDAKHKDYIVYLSGNIDFTGWKTLEVSEKFIPNMEYPVQMKSFLIENVANGAQGAAVLFGDIAVEYE